MMPQHIHVLNRNNTALRQPKTLQFKCPWPSQCLSSALAWITGKGFRADRRLDLKNHADMTVCGSIDLVYEESGRTIDVFSFDPKQEFQKEKSDRVISLLMICKKRLTIWVVHQSLPILHLSCSLILPFQMRDNEGADSETKFRTIYPTWDDHAIMPNERYWIS